MSFSGFSQDDFDIFTVPGLDERMAAIQQRIQPKFDVLGRHFASYLSARTGEEMFYHIAKHARRTVNPPKDTWVAFSNNKRGYKMVPHFQIGLWNTHLFVWFAIIYEAPSKAAWGEKWLDKLEQIHSIIPPDYLWCWDHTKADAYPHQTLTHDELRKHVQRLIEVKKAEMLCGIHIDRHDPVLSNGERLIQKIEHTFETLVPLYCLP